MKVLTAVMTYNRPDYLRNCLYSIEQFFPETDVVVCDDGSDVAPDLRFHDARLQRFPRGEGYHGGLYRMMNWAIEQAIHGGYDFLNLVQDDQQYLWNDPELLTKVQRIFDCHSDALMVLNVFHKGVMRRRYEAERQLIVQGKSLSYRSSTYAVVDTGILSMERVKRWGFRYSESERKTSDRLFNADIRLYGLSSPTCAFIPWPACYRNGQRRRSWPFASRLPRLQSAFYLTPLDADQSGRLLTRPIEQIPYLEDYSEPDGWRCLKPYWFGAPSREYFSMLWQDRIVPKFAGAL